MEKLAKFKDKMGVGKSEKAGAVRRALAVAGGSFLLYRAIKKRKMLKGLGAGYLIFRGLTGKGLKKAIA